MPKLPGINHLRAIKAFEKAGFQVVRQGKLPWKIMGVSLLFLGAIQLMPLQWLGLLKILD